ncbi:MAG: hypothetical protein V8Q86_09895 [Blautia sp.]
MGIKKYSLSFQVETLSKAIEPYTEKFFGVMPSRVDFLSDIYGIDKKKCGLLVMGADDDAVAEAKKPK